MAALSWRFVQVTIARNTAVIRRGLHEGRILAGDFGCFVNFLVMFGYIWVYFWVYLESFCKGLVKSMDIKKLKIRCCFKIRLKLKISRCTPKSCPPAWGALSGAF